MWWKILIGVLCLVYAVSPADLSPLFVGLDDVAAIAGAVVSAISMIKGVTGKIDSMKKGGNSGNGGNYSDNIRY